MRLRCIPERVPGPLPEGSCPVCGRRKIPYVPTCLCGKELEPEGPALDIRPGLRAPKGPGVFRIAHWSDLHMGSKSPDGFGVEVRLRTLFKALDALEVDGLIVSGDLTKFGSVQELSEARDLFDAYGYGAHRRILIPGNHDVPRMRDCANFREVFQLEFPLIEEFGPKVWVVAFDSNVLDERMLFERRWVNVRGRVGREPLEKVRKAWPTPPEGARLLVLHHHLARLTPESRWDIIDARTLKADQRLMAPLVDAEAVLAFADEMKITAAFHGHKHWYSRTGYRVGSIPVFNAGSVTRMLRPQFRVFDFKDGVWEGLYRVEVRV